MYVEITNVLNEGRVIIIIIHSNNIFNNILNNNSISSQFLL